MIDCDHDRWSRSYSFMTLQLPVSGYAKKSMTAENRFTPIATGFGCLNTYGTYIMIYYTVLERYQENLLELMVANDKIALVIVANTITLPNKICCRTIKRKHIQRVNRDSTLLMEKSNMSTAKGKGPHAQHQKSQLPKRQYKVGFEVASF